MQTIEEQFSMALHNSARAYKQALNRRLRDLGVGQSGWLTIALIARSNNSLSQVELSKLAGVEPPSMVPMLDRLAKHGYVKRVASKSDKRIKLIALTANGKSLYKKIKSQADLLRSELLSTLSKKELHTIVPLLEHIYQAAEAN